MNTDKIAAEAWREIKNYYHRKGALLAVLLQNEFQANQHI